MDLKPEEYELIGRHMFDFKITYQATYHEILDYVTTDIERKRDQRICARLQLFLINL